jgi:Flp pilus assembly protein TadD
MRVRVLCFAVALVLAARVGFAQNAAQRILVMPFTVTSVSAASPTRGDAAGLTWLGEAAAVLIADECQAVGLNIFSRDERVETFDRLQLPLSATLTRATMIRAGELAGASHLIVGEVQAGDHLVVRARILRLDLGEQLGEQQATGQASDLYGLFERLATELLRSSGLALAKREPPTHPELDVFEDYIKGLIAVDPGVQQRLLETAYQRAPRDARVLLALWSVYSEVGQHAKALASARSVPSDSPFSRRARFAAALSLIELKRLNEAFKTLSDLQAERPAAAVENNLGIVQLRRGTVPDGRPAAYYFQQAAQAEPEDTDYLFNLGYNYAINHDSAAALFWLRQAVRFDAADGDAHYVMSAVLAAGGRTVESQRELELAKLLGTRHDVATDAAKDKVPSGW